MTTQYTAQELKTGLSLAVIANIIWGVSALYWVETYPVRPQDVVAHRAIWSLPVAAAVLIWAGRLRATWSLLRVPSMLIWSLLGAVLLSVNWGVFVYAVSVGRATEVSLGYFMLPLLTILVGRLAFREVLGPMQWTAISLAVMAVALQLWAYGSLPWVSLVVAGSFSVYAAIRKKIVADTMQGLFIETLCMAPFALAWFWLTGGRGHGNSWRQGRYVFVARGCLHRRTVTELYRGVPTAATERGGLDLLFGPLSPAARSADCTG